MTEQPTTLVHLYMNPKGPFHSISDLPEAEAFRLMDEMTKSTEWHLPRFTKEKRERYMEARRRSEDRLHTAFAAKGGCPVREHPYYLFLETQESQSFWPSARRVIVPLDALPSEIISFTYLDSMVCDALLHNPEHAPENCKQFAELACLNQVYRREELSDLIREFGLPRGTYLEAQVWADDPLNPYREISNN